MLLAIIINAAISDLGISQAELAKQTGISRKSIRGMDGSDGIYTAMPKDETLERLVLWLNSLDPPLVYKGVPITTSRVSLVPGDLLVFPSYNELRELQRASLGCGSPVRQRLQMMVRNLPEENLPLAQSLLAGLGGKIYHLQRLVDLNFQRLGGRAKAVAILAEGNPQLREVIEYDLDGIKNSIMPGRSTLIAFARHFQNDEGDGFSGNTRELDRWLSNSQARCTDSLSEIVNRHKP